MVCGECGSTIADKAIVCYRCGAPTAVPASPTRPAPRRRLPLLAVVLAIIATVFAWLALDAPAESTGRLAYGAAAVVVLILGFRRMVRRGRR